MCTASKVLWGKILVSICLLTEKSVTGIIHVLQFRFQFSKYSLFYTNAFIVRKILRNKWNIPCLRTICHNSKFVRFHSHALLLSFLWFHQLLTAHSIKITILISCLWFLQNMQNSMNDNAQYVLMWCSRSMAPCWCGLCRKVGHITLYFNTDGKDIHYFKLVHFLQCFHMPRIQTLVEWRGNGRLDRFQPFEMVNGPLWLYCNGRKKIKH